MSLWLHLSASSTSTTQLRALQHVRVCRILQAVLTNNVRSLRAALRDLRHHDTAATRPQHAHTHTHSSPRASSNSLRFVTLNRLHSVSSYLRSEELRDAAHKAFLLLRQRHLLDTWGDNSNTVSIIGLYFLELWSDVGAFCAGF